MLTPERISRIQEVASKRQHDLTVVLENVHDPHNLGAVLRTCDSVGIYNIYIIYTEEGLQKRGVQPGHKSASGSRKWVNLHYFTDLNQAIQTIKQKYHRLMGALIGPTSQDLYEVDWCGPAALVFGNEHTGLSHEIQPHLDGNFMIPQVGFVKSLNISVACAVGLYEVYRQRYFQGQYQRKFGDLTTDVTLSEDYVRRHNRIRSKGRIQ